MQERTSGRKKGTPNKRTLLFEQALDDANFDLVEKAMFIHDEAIRIHNEAVADALKVRLENEKLLQENPDARPKVVPRINPFWLTIAKDCIKDLLPYKFPKRKTVEVTGGETEKEPLKLAYQDPATVELPCSQT